MRLFGYHVPGTRDLQREIEQLRQQIELLQKERELSASISKNLRDQNHQLRMDLGKAHQTLDEWMGHYDALRRDLQQRMEQTVRMQLETDPIAQMRALREQVRKEQGRAQEQPQSGEIKSEGAQ